MNKKIVLAFSGGLDTSFCIPYLLEQNYEVHTLFVNTGGISVKEERAITKRAVELGAKKHLNINVEKSLWSEVLTPLIYSGALYQNKYPVLCSDRYLIVKESIKLCQKLKTKNIAHGCTGMGNDQVRFDLSIRAHGSFNIITPIREIQNSTKNVIISWSLNPQVIIEQEEKGTPNLEQRLEAARLCAKKGYKIGIHLDPIIIFPDWERSYHNMIKRIFEVLSPKQIEWISLGSFRFRKSLKKIINERHKNTRLFTGEHIASKDGKHRYLRSLRNGAYKNLRQLLKSISSDLDVYVCMETKEIWEGVTGKMPRSDENLDKFFDL